MIDSPKEYSPEHILSALHIKSYESSSSQNSKIGIMQNSIVGHFGLERTLKRFKDLNDTWDTNDNMFDISLIIVLVVRK